MHVEHGSDEFVWFVLDAVLHGSSTRIAFWHASTSLSTAQQWHPKADATRSTESGSQPSKGGKRAEGELAERIAIRIDISQWYQSGSMEEQGLIDLSTPEAQKRFLLV